MHERFRDRRRAVRDAGLRRRRRLMGSALALVLLAAVGTGIVYSPLFAVSEVAVSGTDGERAAEVAEVTAVTPGENLLFVDLEATAAAVRRLPWVAGAEVRRLPPSTLEVSVSLREPAAVVRLSDSSWLVDAEGILIGGGTRDGLVRIDVPGAALPSVGARVEDAGVRAALGFAAGLPDAVRARVERYVAPAGQPLRAVVTLGTNPEGAASIQVVLGAPTDIAAKGEALELVLARVNSDPALDVTGREINVTAPENPVLSPLP